MPKARSKSSEPALGYEAQLWQMADALRNNMDAAEYKHVSERDNPSLKGVLPKDLGRPILGKKRLGQIIGLESNIALGRAADRAKDTLGRVCEYLLSRFARATANSGGQFYTPSRVVLVSIRTPNQVRVYDPCCGSGGMFVQSEKFIEAHSGELGDISIYGEESSYTTWGLARMNLAIRGVGAAFSQARY